MPLVMFYHCVKFQAKWLGISEVMKKIVDKSEKKCENLQNLPNPPKTSQNIPKRPKTSQNIPKVSKNEVSPNILS